MKQVLLMRSRISIFVLLLLAFKYGNSQTVVDTLVNVGSHQLHFKIIEGQGTPILFEAGNGDDASVWEPLLHGIHEATGATLITYDRAGLGKSGIDTSKISFKGEVKNLRKALGSLGYKNEYFLVAHSFGSFYASEFSKRRASKIDGAVFIDVSTPCAFNIEYATRVKKTISKENLKLIKEYKTGLYYVLDRLPEITDYMADRFISNSIPLTIIAADIRKPSLPIGETEADMRNMTSCLEHLGRRPGNKYVLAKDTEHKVWEKSPDLVSQEIILLYKQTRKP